MYTILVVVQVVSAIAVVGLVLLQHGKGADAGAAFGSGASGTVFGARGSANFLTRSTGACATLFMAASLALAYVVQGQKTADSVVEQQAQAVESPIEESVEVPAVVVPEEGAPAETPVEDQVPQVPE